MRTITAHRAQPISGDQTEPCTIVITEVFPESLSPGDGRAIFAIDAAALFDALFNALPGGTLDQLLALMMESKLSQFRVAFGDLKKGGR